jgi:hypothetical protein
MKAVEAVLHQPAGAGTTTLRRGVGEDDDACARRQGVQRLPGAGRRIDILDVLLEEEVEELAAGGDVQVLGFAGPEDVLEEGESLDPHLQPVSAEEPLEAAHEHGQHLIHVHHHQRRGGIEAEVGDLRREDEIGQFVASV